jgi:multiple sugar transport system ATP-binding protein
MATVQFKSLRKSYGDMEVVHGIDLEIADGEFLVLVGPSGCGKSTSLRMLAGLEDITGGDILINDRVVNEVEPRDRDIAMVFQDYALYPHMSVYQNLAFSLRYRNVKKDAVRARVANAAEILGLEELLDRRPKQLSGGQRQRVAMGRAIVREPQVFLFDEPLSNLDAKLRGSMRQEMKKLHRRLGVTTVYVTHDQIEAMTLADRVVVMNNGIIEQTGTPDEVYRSPNTLFVAGFIGAPTMNLLHGRSNAAGDLVLDQSSDQSVLGVGGNIEPDRALVFGIRPEKVSIAGDGDSDNVVSGTVEVVEMLGADTLVFARVGDAEISARLPSEIRPKPGETLRFSFNMTYHHLFDSQSGTALQREVRS